MFNPDFYPTPYEVIQTMCQGIAIKGKVFLEPEVGTGAIVDYLLENDAKAIIGCENDPKIKIIAATKCKLIAEDFLTVTSDMISHIDAIVMNPPFSRGVEHILHAFNIAPPGCLIVSLCNESNLKNDCTNSRKELLTIIENRGNWTSLGDCFADADRKTGVIVAVIRLQKPGQTYTSEFDGFFLEDDEEEKQENGLMSYNVVRDLVNRYVSAVKLFDEQLAIGVKMNALLSGFYGNGVSFSCSENGQPKLRNDFKKDMQRDGWTFIFNKMDMAKYATRGLKEDINKFVEQQIEIPFTMKNIYRMLDIVIGTTTQRMDKALLEVFDKLTEHHHDNRLNIEGWKTNSHYLVNKKFILPNMCYQDQRYYKGQSEIQTAYGGYFDFVEDMMKALCYISGDRYEKLGTLKEWIRYPYKTITEDEVFYHTDHNGWGGHTSKKDELYKKGIACEMVHSVPIYGEWFEWAYFRCKCFKKGSMHFEFKEEELWAKFNQRISKLKGYPLFEGKTQTKYQDKQTGRAEQKKANPAHAFKPTVLFEVKVA